MARLFTLVTQPILDLAQPRTLQEKNSTRSSSWLQFAYQNFLPLFIFNTIPIYVLYSIYLVVINFVTDYSVFFSIQIRIFPLCIAFCYVIG